MAATKTKDEKKAARDPHEVIAKVTKLVSLAASDNEEEARNAALQAARMMREHDLVLLCREDLERAQRTIEGARELAKTQKEAQNKQLLIGLALGYFGGKGL